MTRAERIVAQLRDHGVGYLCWLPDSETHFLHGALLDDTGLEVVHVCAEGEALAIAAGMNVAGTCATVLIEDQGLFDSGNALKWVKTLQTPIVLLVGYSLYSNLGRHGYVEPFLRAFEVPYFVVGSDDEVDDVTSAFALARETRGVVAVLLGSGDDYHPGTATEEHGAAIRHGTPASAPGSYASSDPTVAPTMERLEALRAVTDLPSGSVVITTMSAVLDWSHLDADGLLHFHVAGAMGYASSFGLGVALAQPARTVVVVEGDGSLLMNLGSLVTAAAAAPPNLIVVLMENGVYELVGGLRTPGRGLVDFEELARGAGWASVLSFEDRAELHAGWPGVLGAVGPTLIRLPVRMGAPQRLVLGNPPGIEHFIAGLTSHDIA